MNPIEMIERDIKRALPTAWTRLRRPRKAEGQWWLDAKKDEHVVTVQWAPRRGFGVSASLLGDGYGEGAEETFESLEDAVHRVIGLLRAKSHTLPPEHVFLREVRGRLGVTQAQLAERLGVQQAAVSRLERREDITLSSLRRFVSALGGDLEIGIRTPAGERIRLAGFAEQPSGRAEEGSFRYQKRSTGLSLLVIRALDLERSRAFYSTLGLDLTPEKHGDGPLHYSSDLDGTIIELYPTKVAATPTRIGFRIPNPGGAIEALLSSGLLKEAPSHIPRGPGAKVSVVRDLDGNMVELSAL